VSWKFWKTKDSKPKHEIVSQAVPYSTLYRWFCYDVGVSDLDALDKQVGLMPISFEVKEMEEQESDLRIATVEPLIPFMDAMADISSMVYVQTQLKELLKGMGTELDEDDLEKMLNTMGLIQKVSSFAAIVGAFSAASSLGIISITDTEITDMVGDFNEFQ
jgi:hypothetical protein